MVKKIKGVKVKIVTTKYFESQHEAREFAIKILQSGITFLELDEWTEEVEDPEPEPKAVMTTPDYPKMIEAEKVDHRKYPHHVRKKPRPKKGTKSTQESQLYDSGVKKKVNNEILEFIRDNCLEKDDETLVKEIKKQFGVDTKINTIKYWMSRNGISRRKIRAGELQQITKPKRKYKYSVKPGRPGKYPEEMEDFCRENMDKLTNEELVREVNKKFDLNTTEARLAAYLHFKGLKRANRKARPDKEGMRSKYPDEMKEFIESRMETTTNQDLTDLINEKWDLGLTKERLKSYMKYNQLKRVNIIRSPRRTNAEIGEKKKIGKPKIYTDEVLQFLRDNVNNFKNKELCEELESRFNIKTTPDSLSQTLCNKGIRRDIQPDVELEVEDFILKSKEKDAYLLRDKIIEKLGKNVPTRKIINIMGKRKEDLPGESVEEEVDRIEAKRSKQQSDPFDDEVDELDLDD